MAAGNFEVELLLHLTEPNPRALVPPALSMTCGAARHRTATAPHLVHRPQYGMTMMFRIFFFKGLSTEFAGNNYVTCCRLNPSRGRSHGPCTRVRPPFVAWSSCWVSFRGLARLGLRLGSARALLSQLTNGAAHRSIGLDQTVTLDYDAFFSNLLFFVWARRGIFLGLLELGQW